MAMHRVNKKLIVNADDFGLHLSINEAVEEAHRHGILKSASLVVNGEAFEDAISIAKRNNTLGIGLHLNLIGEKPVASADIIRSIVGPDGMLFEDHRKLCIKILKKEVLLKDIIVEIEAQIDKFFVSGLIPTHIDSHRHLHMFPPIFNSINSVLRKYHIKKMRYLNIPYFEFRRLGFNKKTTAIFLKTFSFLKRKKYRHPDFFCGFFDSGHINEDRLICLLQNLKPGITELNLHPGKNNKDIGARYSIWDAYFPWKFDWENELKVLLSDNLMVAIDEQEIKLINYTQI